MTIDPDIIEILPDRRMRSRNVPLTCRKRLCVPASNSRRCAACQRIFFKEDVRVAILPAKERL